MSDHKRKRNSSKEDRPSKKVAIALPNQPSTVKVSFLNDNDEWGPIVASSPGLAIQETVRFQPFKKPRSNFSSRQPANQQTSSSSHEILLHSSSHPKIDYVAREEGGGGGNDSLKHFVGIYDPHTGTLEVVETRNATVRGTIRSEGGESGEFKEKQSNQAARQDLGRAFGTRKAQKAIASLTENAIRSPQKLKDASANGNTTHRSPPPMSDPAAAAMLESIAESTKDMATREQLQATTDENKPRPAANMDATDPADVYRLESLVGEEELRALAVREWLTAVEQNRAVKTKSLFVSRRLHGIASSGDVQKLKVLRYLLILLDFYSSLKPSKIRSDKKLPDREELKTALGVPDVLIESVRRRFSSKASLSKWHIDNLLTHIAAITLHIDGGFDVGVDFYDLREDLRMETQNLTRYFQEIGCKVSALTEADRNRLGIATKAEAAQHRIAKLTIPVTFPVVRMRRRR
ncbi:MAG: DNA-directed RNA polymerase I subunit rpa49 [Chaenotheca gracillima]|nr:MAG: DNA-directed RNA polymerase I subunit rpa49 [Chaenotheca gracillima]